MPVKLNSTGGGSVTLDTPSTASNFTATFPANTGNVVTTGSSAVVTPAMLTQPLTSGTAQNSTSGTSIDFTGIPSWVKRITVSGINVSTNGSSLVCLKVGTSSGIVTSGYVANWNNFNGTTFGGSGNNTGEFAITGNGSASDTRQFTAILTLQGNNGWTFFCIGAATNASGNTSISAGAIILGATLDRVRITTINGTDTFDLGSINILYE